MRSPREMRHRLIRDLIDRNAVETQDQLLALLEVEDVLVTQGTLSRDLRSIGIRKTATGYVLPGTGPDRDRRRNLADAVVGSLRSVGRSGTLVVLRTRAGRAQRVATDIEDGRLPEVMGVIAGRDTVFIASADADAARSLARWLGRAVA